MSETKPFEMPSLSGEEVVAMKDKSFEVVSQRIKPFKDQQTGESQERAVLGVKLADGSVADYVPNGDALRALIAARGRDRAKWIGFKGAFETEKKKVYGVMKEIIHIKA